MTCYGPIVGYYAAKRNENGKRGIVFDKRKALSGVPLKLPCGKCVGCRHDYARTWAIRCMHEKQMHDASSFLTLTYADEKLPEHGSLRKRELQLFMKRLRIWFDRNGVKEYDDAGEPVGLRFYGCGEYGTQLFRPHYHVLLFNRDFADKKFVKNSGSGEPLFHSDVLRDIWRDGEHWIGAVTAQSCAYVARYVLKKVGKEITPDGCEPEFTVMSRRPGIAAAWFEKYHKGVYDWDSVVFGEQESRPPRFYDTRFEKANPERMEVLKRRRRKMAMLNRVDSTKARLRVREVFQLRKDAFFSKRGF